MNTRSYSKKQETRVAKAMSGKVQANSGATPFRKGDVLTKRFLIECKTSVKEMKSFSIQKEVLEKSEEERFAMGKDFFAVAIDFGCPQGETYFIVKQSTLITLLEEGEQHERN